MTKQWIQFGDAVINLSKVDVVHKTFDHIRNGTFAENEDPIILFTKGETEVWCERFESVEERDNVFSQILEMPI